ncbi:peptide MFS transporter [Photobacterium lutimaris]|uniref:MFS transporter n=1 Tax=Photobacterium lutimaris TaxID=388278 RepID=A0A2T3J0H7_9GAMM|nr:peptide MFS transporter [Photobacterium lutimaris]PSU34592.1 MFS transporter [Photobacterium lutimaris]TDR71570.1 amino acid/peptide:H+ symporter [Photobacterium lutimaris]
MQDANSRFPFIARVLILRQFLWGAAFYGTYVLLTKFFLVELNYSEADTIMMMGAFGAVGPVFSAVGGFVADRYIGSFRAVYIGYTVYTIGFFTLGYGASSLNVPLSIFAIALIGYARGLSATSPTVLLGNSYAADNRDAFQQGLTVNYSINNLGSFASKYLFPFMVAFLAYQGNFYIASGLMSITLVLFVLFRDRFIGVGNDIDRRSVSMKVWMAFVLGSAVMLGLVFWVFSNLDEGKYLLYALGAGAIGYFIYEITRATTAFKYKMCGVLILIFIMIVFYFYYGQMLTSMNIYAINLMGDHLFGLIPIRPESNAAFNPLWCFVLGGPVIFIYGWLERKGISPSIPTKFAAAFIFSAIAFSLLGLSTSFVGDNGKISADWILWVHFFQSLAELIVGALGAGFIFEMVPRYLSAFSIGLRSVALSLSGILAAVISTKIALPKDVELTQEIIESVYASYFFNLAILAVVMAFVTLALSKVITKLIRKGEELEKEDDVKPMAPQL